MSNTFYEEITGQSATVDFQGEIESIKRQIRAAKDCKCHAIEIFQLSNRARGWLEESPFLVERVDEIFVLCEKNDSFNVCDCYPCRHAGDLTGEKKWRISWPKTVKK